MKSFIKKYKIYIIILFVMTAAIICAFFFADGKGRQNSSSGSEHYAASDISSESLTASEVSEVSETGSGMESGETVSYHNELSSETELCSETSSSRSELYPDPDSSENSYLPEETSTVSQHHPTSDSAAAVSSDDSSEVILESSSASRIASFSELSVEPSSEARKLISDTSQQKCIIYISCETAVNNPELEDKKKQLLGADGIILSGCEAGFEPGESVLDVLKRVCKENGIILSTVSSPFGSGGYIEGINDLHERDCGAVSGWMYSVNDLFPNVGCSDYKLSAGDVVRILYTCDLGKDIGNIYIGG